VKPCSAKDDQQPDFKIQLKKFLFYWFPILIYCLLIFIQSSHPSIEHISDWPNIDKVLHFAAYALLGAFFLRDLKTPRIKNILNLVLIRGVRGLLTSALDTQRDGVSVSIPEFGIPDLDEKTEALIHLLIARRKQREDAVAYARLEEARLAHDAMVIALVEGGAAPRTVETAAPDPAPAVEDESRDCGGEE